MHVEYRDQKNLPCEELYQLFLAVGWATADKTTQAMIDNFNIGFLDSTFVFSAWIDERLVGCVRVLSDLNFRSVIYDLAVCFAGISKDRYRKRTCTKMHKCV